MTVGARLAGMSLKLVFQAYRLFLSPVLPVSCRFVPTCSEYALDALDRHGPAVGLGLAVWRILRCQPWGGCGHDPVPEKPVLFGWRRI